MIAQRLLPIAFAFAFLAAPALKAEPSPQEKALAEQLFQEGRALLDKGSVAEACSKLEESYRIDPGLGTLLNVATCHERAGKSASAWAEFKECMTQAKEAGQAERLDYARDHATRLEKQLSRLVIRVSDDARVTDVKLDDREIRRPVWGVPMPVDPGHHRIVASNAGKIVWSRELDAPAGPATRTVTIEIERPASPAKMPPPPPPAKTPAEDSSGLSTTRVLGIGLLGVGAAGLAVGTLYGLRTFDKKKRSDDHCDDTGCDADGLRLNDDAHHAATISTIAFAIGAVALGAGTWLVLIPDNPHDSRTGARLSLSGRW